MTEEKKKGVNEPGKQGGPYDKSYTAESAKGYIPVDTTTTNNSRYYAEKAGMGAEDKNALEQAGIDYNTAKDANDEAGMAAAHERAENIRGKYGYSGGVDGSELRPKQNGGTAGDTVDKLPNRAPDLTGLLDGWLESSKQQLENKVDYAVQQGVTELQRAEEDAHQKFQTQQAQVSKDEAKALDNQALYAEVRGDRGGIGQAQYAQIQANAMTNRRTINSARTKLATDTARQIADLRSQGEFQKADAVLELTQSYLSQLMDLEKWGAEFNLGVDQFNSQIERWQADFDASVGEMLGNYKGVPTLENQKFQTSAAQAERETLAASGAAALSAGIRPSAAQQAAMGYTDVQVEAELAAYQLARAADVKKKTGGVSKPRLTAAQTLRAVEEGILSDSVLSAFEYWYGQPYAAEEEPETESEGYTAVLNQLMRIEDSSFAERTKIGEIIDVIEGATEDGVLTENQALKLLRQYGLH